MAGMKWMNRGGINSPAIHGRVGMNGAIIINPAIHGRVGMNGLIINSPAIHGRVWRAIGFSAFRPIGFGLGAKAPQFLYGQSHPAINGRAIEVRVIIFKFSNFQISYFPCP
jgi:hypothetical protein